jgi:hypothetical protein
LYNSKKPTGDPTYSAIVRCVKKAWNHIKEKMDCSGGGGLLNDAVIAGADIGDDVVDGEEEGAEETTKNLGEASNEVASGEETMVDAATSRCESTGRESVVSTVRGMDHRVPSLPPLPPLQNFQIRSPRDWHTTNPPPAAAAFAEMIQFLMMMVEADNKSTK